MSIFVQSDWADVIKDSSQDRFWISFIKESDAVHSHCSYRQNKLDFDHDTFSGNISIIGSSVVLNVAYKEHKSMFVSSYSTKCCHEIPIACDLNVSSGYSIAGLAGGDVHVCDPEDVVSTLDNAHLFDVTVARLFPSGVVGITGSTDMDMHIWALATENPYSVCKLSGSHRATITAVDFIDRGKHIVSSDRNGLVNVWEIQSQSVVRHLTSQSGSINDIRVSDQSIFCASNHCTCYDLRSCDVCFSIPCDSSLNAICCSSHFLVTGSQSGLVSVIDLRNHSVVSSFSVAAPITSIDASGESVVIALGAGDCREYALKDGVLSLVKQFSGPDCLSVCNLRLKDNYLITSSRDCFIRKYHL